MKFKKNKNSLIAMILFALFSARANGQNEDFFNKADAFFNKYVQDDLVDYKGIKNSPDELNVLNLAIREYYPEGVDTTAKAFYINAYNILVIQQIVDDYPVESPQEISGFFDATKFKVGSKNLTLNDIENKILRKEYRDYRLHFVLVCGAMGCPPIANFAYRPEKLNEQLDSQASKAFNDPKSSNDRHN